ncbi:sulfatase family protein [Aurantiacibacter sp. MUD61]|uniref:sulfatase family protein n=1 Tax=Aurantiacibacter sp. MUD61 TaxID=3009083 RepID=UPI0022F06350|nr:sulfatase [Aurantiacibacter sp. MUD61]
MKSIKLLVMMALIVTGCVAPGMQPAAIAQDQAAERPNIIFILNDDQRFDAMGFIDETLDTPNMDRIAREGVHFPNAFVTTALCSPSRASILTGQYMHNHGIADNNIQFREGTRFFSQDLQEAGYETAFIGKWHMGGHGDDPQPGFDHWISFRGQGNYLPENGNGVRHMLNINGERVEQQGYITDELNQFALDWLAEQDGEEPFFLYLSHKAVHADFIPAERHENQYSREDITVPASMANTPENNEGKPMWVINQRNGWHGVDFPYHSTLDIVDYRLRYNQTLSAVDDGIGAIIAQLEEQGLMENTIIVMMGDNGFMFGEHGLIDKRNAYEESMRVPFIAFGAGMPAGRTDETLIANIDIASTFLDLAGTQPSAPVDGMSFANQLMGLPYDGEWREGLNYEYFWEYNYPHTPTTLAIRGDRYKYIQYHGVWDTEELYDLQEDPNEMNNLIASPEHQEVLEELRRALFANLGSEDGRAYVTFTRRNGEGAVLRNRNGSEAAEFPDRWLRDGTETDLRDNLRTEGGNINDPNHE